MNSSERALLRRMSVEKNCKLTAISKERRPDAKAFAHLESVVSAQISSNKVMRNSSMTKATRISGK